MGRRIVALVILIGPLWLALSQQIRTYSPPSKEQRKAAIGQTQYLPSIEKSTFTESSSFAPKTAPAAMDWLASHPEPGQTFDQFLRTRRNLFKAPRTVIYIQPLGAFSAAERTVLTRVAEYARIFFDAEVKIQKILDPESESITTRDNPYSGQKQFLSTDILKLLKRDMPDDAYARIAVTMTDLYPDPNWNFVFGQASFVERVGVYSFARYGEVDSPVFLRRCIQVFAHETGHMFAFMHCIHFQCLMNGSNHLGESDKTPLHLCPVCLRKLHAANHFDIVSRYQAMVEFLRRNGLEDEAAWVDRRLKDISGVSR